MLCLGYAEALSSSYNLYIDADFDGAQSSSFAIEQGIRTALDEVDYMIGGTPVELITRNHRGNTRRSRAHLHEIAADPYALALYCGLHSPPVLDGLAMVHEEQLLLLDPWAAAAPITRFNAKTNWVFRLSLDDSKVGRFLVDHLVQDRSFSSPALLLEDTGWGRSNEKNMGAALQSYNLLQAPVYWFSWNLKEITARRILRELKEQGADCVVLVANSAEGAVWVQAMAALEPDMRLPIISHWGITGGDFFERTAGSNLRQVDLSFVQSDFKNLYEMPASYHREVIERAERLFGFTQPPSRRWKAPAGFVHGYDITRLFIEAASQAALTGSAQVDRARIRTELEQLEKPVSGLLKVYQKPYGVFSEEAKDAHEALSVSDYMMAKYDEEGWIIPLHTRPMLEENHEME